MRVFVTGASGAIGTRLVPQLIDAGHEVIGTHRMAAGARQGFGREATAAVSDVARAASRR
jgi:uncharacterized protein YbjT (DUF2867 family)